MESKQSKSATALTHTFSTHYPVHYTTLLLEYYSISLYCTYENNIVRCFNALVLFYFILLNIYNKIRLTKDNCLNHKSREQEHYLR